MSFRARLEAIHYDLDANDEALDQKGFLDPISGELFNDPVLADDYLVYERVVALRLINENKNGATGKPVTKIVHAAQDKSDLIEIFVQTEEKKYRKREKLAAEKAQEVAQNNKKSQANDLESQLLEMLKLVEEQSGASALLWQEKRASVEQSFQYASQTWLAERINIQQISASAAAEWAERSSSIKRISTLAEKQWIENRNDIEESTRQVATHLKDLALKTNAPNLVQMISERLKNSELRWSQILYQSHEDANTIAQHWSEASRQVDTISKAITEEWSEVMRQLEVRARATETQWNDVLRLLNERARLAATQWNELLNVARPVTADSISQLKNKIEEQFAVDEMSFSHNQICIFEQLKNDEQSMTAAKHKLAEQYERIDQLDSVYRNKIQAHSQRESVSFAALQRNMQEQSQRDDQFVSAIQMNIEQHQNRDQGERPRLVNPFVIWASSEEVRRYIPSSSDGLSNPNKHKH